MLLKGPDLLASLPSILFRFRQKQYAVTADIEQMFHRIFVKEDDRYAQKFLWRNCDASREPDVYIMNVLIFGASCSPCISQYVKNLHASKYEVQYPEAVSAIINNHYVDDFLLSADTAEQAIKVSKNVHFIHSEAGFNLRNWCSNSSEVLESLNAQRTEDKCLSGLDKFETEKVLGVFWKPCDDTITFKISKTIIDSQLFIGTKEPTKRELPKILMSVYDSLGLIGNFLMYLKTIVVKGIITLQEIWRSGVGWDESVLQPQVEKWKKWFIHLPKLQELKIPRCYIKHIHNYETAVVDLHVFADASENGYAAVAYFRIFAGNEFVVALIGSKTRVAPLKLASIPRLELMAALIAARYANNIIEGHDIEIRKKVFWSDSKTVLSWIRSDHRKYHQFVAVRVSEILHLSEIADWHWVPGKQNVADEATKWTSVPNLSESGRWFNGPEFLKLPEHMWPKEISNTAPTQVEIKQCLNVVTASEPLILLNRFSLWTRALRTTAFVIKFCRLLINKSYRPETELTQSEISAAEVLLVKQAQRESFFNEIGLLEKNKYIPKGSSIYKLSPFLHSDGILRVNSRISNANVPEELMYPAILPKDCYLTKLLILHYHNLFHHANSETAVNELRQRAVHIELVSTLNTSSCIMAIRNFICRRGTPRELFSDNGTNFVGAERELRQAIKEIDTNELIRSFTSATMKWNFNSPSSPHMGGAWERLVRSVKTVLYKILPERCPSEEVLRSMMAEVENIINSRPLTYIPIDGENKEALTPNHLLLGSSNGLKPLASYDDAGVVLRQSWLSSQQVAEQFWRRWVSEYLSTLTCRTKWFEKAKPLEVGDLVVVVDPSNPRNVWPRGKVIEIFKASDGQVRRAKVLTSCGVLERPAVKLAVLDVASGLE
ncbi:uncharacterized protein LOC142229926 [Haematobia irritans]|uniref:uncharacterized protein LOC142229926 n=1 Tax=Haematobia irritans TaxID=7368 RepID=UPI003F505D83